LILGSGEAILLLVNAGATHSEDKDGLSGTLTFYSMKSIQINCNPSHE
jgi:hypothetical protein